MREPRMPGGERPESHQDMEGEGHKMPATWHTLNVSATHRPARFVFPCTLISNQCLAWELGCVLRGLSCCSASAGCTRFATGATGNRLHAQGLAGSAKINLFLFFLCDSICLWQVPYGIEG